MKTRNTSRQIKKIPTAKINIYERVTAQILHQLEQGVVPWKNPHTAQIGFPRNFNTSSEYRGINVMLLAMARFVSPHFLTYLQAKAMGGQVRKGEKGSLVVKYGEYQKKSEKLQDSDETETRGYLKGYTVFNACQIDGIDFPEPIKPEFTPSDRVKRAEALVAGFSNGPEIREGRGTRTCYNRKNDVIEIPDRAYFDSEEKFYASLFHELCHA
ncbi:ArdC-like ssDNA-binding domain-containing protein, partial [bacterium]|nr:ArdC-like ssDNA-binding domain-containing protein [bacterium]